MEQSEKVSNKKVIKARVFNIVQNEYNPKTGEDLHFNEENIKNCISHKTIKEWCYIRHDKDTYTKDDKERYGRAIGDLKPPHWHLVITSAGKDRKAKGGEKSWKRQMDDAVTCA